MRKPFNIEKWIRLMLPMIVLVGSVISLFFGWGLDVEFFKGGNGNSTIKIPTILFFITSSSIFIVRNTKCKPLEFSFWFYHLMWLLILGLIPLFGEFAINPYFLDNDFQTISPHYTSRAAIVCFWLIAIGTVSKPPYLRHKNIPQICGSVILAISLVALVGHIINQPALYYFSTLTTAMAVPTAIMFIPLSITLMHSYK